MYKKCLLMLTVCLLSGYTQCSNNTKRSVLSEAVSKKYQGQNNTKKTNKVNIKKGNK